MVWKARYWPGFPKRKCDYQNILVFLLLLYGVNRVLHVLQAGFYLCLLKYIFRQRII